MNRILRTLAVASLILPVLAIAVGCSGSTRTGAPYTMKPDRSIEAYLPGAVPTVHEEALYVVREHFGYRLVREAVDLREGYIEARTAMDNVVRIKSFISGPTITRVEIYVGPMGDEPAMKDILAEIDLQVNKK